MNEDKKAKRFHWIKGGSVAKLRDALNASNPESTRVEFHEVGDQLWIHVEPDGVAEADCPAPINESHICPIDCP